MSKKRIAISSDDKLTISEHLGTCKYIAIYELENNDVVHEKFIKNEFTHVKGKSDSHDGFADALQNCDVVISRGIGVGLEQGFNAAQIGVCIVEDEGRLMQILFRFIQGKLTETGERICRCVDE